MTSRRKRSSGAIRALTLTSKLISARADRDELLEAVLGEAVALTGADRGLIALMDRNGGELVIRGTAGEGWTEEKRRVRLRVGITLHEGITGYVASRGVPYRTGDVSRDPHYVELFEDCHSELAVPMIRSGGRVIGVLNVESVCPRAFSKADEEIALALAAAAAVGVSQAEHRARERALIAVGQQLSAAPDVNVLLHHVTAAAAQILSAHDSSLFLLDEEGLRLNLVASVGPLQHLIGEAHYHAGEGLTGWVAERDEPVNIPVLSEDPRWEGKYEEVPREEAGAFMAAPIPGPERVEGVLRLVRRKAPRSLPNEFDRDDMEVLLTLASQVAVGIQRARLLDRLVHAERMAAWGEMSARMAHMIGNKVFAMKGHLGEVLHALDAGHCPGECRGTLELLGSSLRQLDEIIQEFKDFVAAPILRASAVDVNALLEESVRHPLEQAVRVQLILNLAPGLPTIAADPARLQACFSELAENAIVWQPEGGELRVTTSWADPEAPRRLAGLRSRGPFVRLDFEDRGPGVPADRKEQIFRPFVSTRGRGMGLGLAICREVFRAHGGQVVEIGTVDRGAHFVVFLPVSPAKEQNDNVQDPRRR
jgi:signal transduction histidine kinase